MRFVDLLHHVHQQLSCYILIRRKSSIYKLPDFSLGGCLSLAISLVCESELPLGCSRQRWNSYIFSSSWYEKRVLVGVLLTILQGIVTSRSSWFFKIRWDLSIYCITFINSWVVTFWFVGIFRRFGQNVLPVHYIVHAWTCCRSRLLAGLIRILTRILQYCFVNVKSL